MRIHYVEKILTEEEELQQEIELNQKLEQFKHIIESVTFDEMMLIDNENLFWFNEVKEFLGDEYDEDYISGISGILMYVFFASLSEEKRDRYINREQVVENIKYDYDTWI